MIVKLAKTKHANEAIESKEQKKSIAVKRAVERSKITILQKEK